MQSTMRVHRLSLLAAAGPDGVAVVDAGVVPAAADVADVAVAVVTGGRDDDAWPWD
jgi:hypothetical protein